MTHIMRRCRALRESFHTRRKKPEKNAAHDIYILLAYFCYRAYPPFHGRISIPASRFLPARYTPVLPCFYPPVDKVMPITHRDALSQR